MTRNAKIQEQEVKEEAPKEEVETPKEVNILESQPDDTPAKAEYRALLARYKAQSPEKYEIKKADFERRLRGDVAVEYSNDGKRKTFKFANTPKE